MNESLWLDEATTALVSKMSLADIFAKFLPGDFHPPLYYLFMKYWVGIFGSSEISLRTPSLIFAILTVWLVYKLAGRVAALLLATAPLLFYYAQEARMYAMTMFFVTLAVFSFVKMRKDRGMWWGIMNAVSLALIAATDYVALLILPVFWFLGRRYWKKLLMSHIILAGFWLVWLPFFVKQLSSGLKVGYESPAWSQLLGQTSIKNIALIPVKFMIGRVGFDNNLIYGFVVVAFGAFYGYLLFKARKVDKVFWLWLIVPVLLGAVIGFWIPTLSYFRYLFVLPAFYVLAAKGIGKSRLLLYLALGVNLLSIIYYLLTPGFHREDWRGAAGAIGDGEIVTPADSQKEALVYYRKGEQIVKAPTGKEIWLSRYVWEVSDPTDSVRKRIESLGYNKVSEHNFNGVKFYKYAHSD